MEETPEAPNYFIDFEGAKNIGRDISLLIAARKCYADRQADTDESLLSSDPKEHLDRIVKHCAETPDYLLPDTPLKDAIFRVMLAAGKQLMTAEEISAELSARWAVSTYPRDLSPKVIGRILDHSESCCVVAYHEPEPEPEPEPEEPAAVEAIEGDVGTPEGELEAPEPESEGSATVETTDEVAATGDETPEAPEPVEEGS